MRLVRGSRYDALYARYQEVCEERDAAVRAADEPVCTIVRLARENDQLRAENERLQRDVARLQERLDDALGLNTAAMDEGARWQERRADVPRPRAPKEGS